jgi:hypothetical protein
MRLKLLKDAKKFNSLGEAEQAIKSLDEPSPGVYIVSMRVSRKDWVVAVWENGVITGFLGGD